MSASDMCVSLNASIHSSVISLVTCGILYFHNFHQDKKMHKIFQTLALFLLFVSVMQWYDIIFWLNQKENITNYVFTKAAMITNHLQPLVFAALVSANFNLSIVTKFIVVFYAVCAIIYSVYVFHKIQYTLVTEKTYPVLEWKWTTFNNSLAFYTVFLLAICAVSLELPYPLNYVILVITLGSVLLAYHKSKKQTIGKRWCIIAAYVPLLLVIFEALYKFKST